MWFDTCIVVATGQISTGQPILTARRCALAAVVVPAALLALGRSASVVIESPPPRDALTGMLVLALLVWLADRRAFPVGDSSMSLAFVFVICAAVMYGAAVAAVITAIAVGAIEFRTRRQAVHAAYNTATWTLVAAASGIAASLGGDSDLGLLVAVLLASAALYVTNIALVAVVAADARLGRAATIAGSITGSGTRPFLLAISIVPLFVQSWRTSHLIALAAGVPLLAIGLHLRSAEQSREATLLALTDPLTGLGNRRHLNDRLRREVARADASGEPFSICLIDLDDFKAVNDRHGHPQGDLALTAVAGVLRRGGEAFRLGGDEFALVLPRHDAERAAEVAAAVSARVLTLREPPATPLSISTGTATYTRDGGQCEDLLRIADDALYAAKASHPGSTGSRAGRAVPSARRSPAAARGSSSPRSSRARTPS